MSREKTKFLLPPPRRKRGGSGVAGVAGVAGGDPRLDVIEAGPLRGRQAVNLAILRGLREHVAEHVRELRRFEGVHGSFARDRARTIEHVLRELERLARLPVDPATDYRGATP
jgi:hypothetical protein